MSVKIRNSGDFSANITSIISDLRAGKCAVRKGRLLEIAPAASDLPDRALLSLFGLYLILVMEADDASSAAAAASVSA